MNLNIPHVGFTFEYLGLEMTIIAVFPLYITAHYVDKLGRIHDISLCRDNLAIITKLEIFKTS